MTSISSTSVYSVSSLFSSKKAKSSSDVMSLDDEDSSSSSSQKSVYSAVSSDDSASSSSSASKLSSALWSLTSSSSDSSSDTSINSQDVAYAADETSSSDSTEQEFSDLTHMTLAERIRQQYLDDNDLTEDDLKTMSADQRAAIEDAIQKQIEAAMKQSQGASGTESATTETDTQQV